MNAAKSETKSSQGQKPVEAPKNWAPPTKPTTAPTNPLRLPRKVSMVLSPEDIALGIMVPDFAV